MFIKEFPAPRRHSGWTTNWSIAHAICINPRRRDDASPEGMLCVEVTEDTKNSDNARGEAFYFPEHALFVYGEQEMT